MYLVQQGNDAFSFIYVPMHLFDLPICRGCEKKGANYISCICLISYDQCARSASMSKLLPELQQRLLFCKRLFVIKPPG